jgi:hypothetical protein
LEKEEIKVGSTVLKLYRKCFSKKTFLFLKRCKKGISF